MKIMHLFQLTLKKILNKKLHSIMIILSISFAVAVTTNVISIVQHFYFDIDNKIINNPSYRLIETLPKYSRINNHESIEKIGNENNTKININYSDLKKIKERFNDIKYTFITENSNFFLGEDPWGRTSKTSENNDLGSFLPENNSISSFWGVATVIDYFDFYNLQLLSGSSFIPNDIESGNTSLILGYTLKMKLYPDIDDKKIIGEKIKLNSRIFEIIGVLEPVDESLMVNGLNINDVSFFPITACWTFIHRGYPREFYVGVDDIKKLKSSKNDIEEYYLEKYGSHFFNINIFADELKMQKKQMTSPLIVIIIICSAIVLIAVINLLNIMYSQVKERYRNISIMLSLGITKQFVFIQILFEVLLLYVSGIIIGFGLSITLNMVFSRILNSFNQNLSIITLDNLILSFICTFVLTMLFAIYPGIIASKVSPIKYINK